MKYKNIDEYINLFDGEIKNKLIELRNIINDVSKDIKETISYNMPAFKINSVLVYFAAYKSHIGFYPTSEPIEYFKDKLKIYKTSKGAIQFKINEKLPKELIQEIVRYRIDNEWRHI